MDKWEDHRAGKTESACMDVRLMGGVTITILNIK
jgi:hypothetical protein